MSVVDDGSVHAAGGEEHDVMHKSAFEGEASELGDDGDDECEHIDLFECIDKNDLQALQDGLDNGEDTEETSIKGAIAGCSTPLLYAVSLGDSRRELIAALLNANADPTQTARNADTALHMAAYKGMYVVAEMLIDAGANLEAVGELGNRPLHLAASANRKDITGLLLSKGAQTIYRNAYGNTPLQVANGVQSKSWIRRVHEGGEAERARLAEQIREVRAAEASAREESSHAAASKAGEAEERAAAARRRREEEDTEEDRVEAAEMARMQAEAEEARRLEEERLAKLEEERIAAEAEAKRLAAEARKKAKAAAAKK